MIIPSSKYPANTAIDLTNYPEGKARNDTAVGSGDGTPLERDWVNDWFGFQQAAMLLAGFTPNGSPDTALACQLMDALTELNARRSIGVYNFALSVRKNSGQTYSLTGFYQRGGYTQPLTDSVQVPTAGKYKISVSGQVDSSSTANPTFISVQSLVGGALTGAGGGGWRYSASATDIFVVSFECVVAITVPASQLITIASFTTGLQWSPSTLGTLTVERVG